MEDKITIYCGTINFLIKCKINVKYITMCIYNIDIIYFI